MLIIIERIFQQLIEMIEICKYICKKTIHIECMTDKEIDCYRERNVWSVLLRTLEDWTFKGTMMKKWVYCQDFLERNFQMRHWTIWINWEENKNHFGTKQNTKLQFCNCRAKEGEKPESLELETVLRDTVIFGSTAAVYANLMMN